MGQVPGEVIAAAFGVFNPEMVKGQVDAGWAKTDAPAILEARRLGATESLRRILGDAPDGMARATELLRRAGDAASGETRALYSGLRSLGWPGDPIGDLWRSAHLVRRHRGGSPNCAFVACGRSAV